MRGYSSPSFYMLKNDVNLMKERFKFKFLTNCLFPLLKSSFVGEWRSREAWVKKQRQAS